MIKLKNIVIENEVVSCNIFPEDSEIPGTIKVDAHKGEIISFCLPDNYTWCKNHLEHAKEYLIKIHKLGKDAPKEKNIMWY